MNAELYPRLLAQLAEPAARALALAVLVGAGLALVRTQAAFLKFTVWRAVLVGALAMPLLARLAPGLPVILPRPAWAHAALANIPKTLPNGRDLLNPASEAMAERNLPSPKRAGQPAIPHQDVGMESESALGTLVSPPPQPHTLAQANPKRAFPLGPIATLIYSLGAAALLARLVLGWVFSRKLARSAEKVTDPRLLALFAEQAAALGPATAWRRAALAVSNSVSVPVTLGTLAPVVVLPAGSAAWDERKCRAVFAHELSHVARRDALTFMFSSLHRCLFWFSPLAWWLDRKLAALAEQASDEWALGRVQDRFYYAELLLEFWKDLDGAPMRVRWEGVSMARRIRMNDRLERILNAPAWSKGIRKPVGAALLLVAAPVLYFAAAVQPALRPQEPTPPAPAVAPAPALAPVRPVAPSPASAPVKPVGGVFGVGQVPHPPATVPVAPGTPALAAAPSAVAAPAPPGFLEPDGLRRGPEIGPALAQDNDFEYGDEEDKPGARPFVIVSNHSHTMSGNMEDLADARSYRHKIQGAYIWFRRNHKEYIIRDQATVERAKALFAPQQELGRKQEALGKQQEQLGAQQEELGKHMEEVRVKLPDLKEELKKIEAELADVDSPRTQEELGQIESELGELQSRIAEAQSRAGQAQGRLGAQQGELGRKQGELGRQQGELGREQGRLAREANRKMKALLDDALAHKTAEPAPE